MTEAASETILREGENCWRIAPAERVAFLVDGEAFFAAFAAAVERAQQSVFIIGWDIDSGVRLWRDGVARDLPAELGDFLNAVVARRKRLRVYILDWDFALLYALEREPPLGGSLLSALSTFGLGRLLGRETVRRLAGARLNRLSRWLGRRGLVAVTAVRLFPVAPFTVVNMVAGASHIRLRDFSFGTLLGMAPGVLAITVFEQSLEQVVAEPAAGNFLLLGGVLLAAAGLAWGVRRRLSRMKPPVDGGKGRGGA